MNIQHRTLIESVVMGFVAAAVMHANGHGETTSALFGLVTVAMNLSYAAVRLAGQAQMPRDVGATHDIPKTGPGA